MSARSSDSRIGEGLAVAPRGPFRVTETRGLAALQVADAVVRAGQLTLEGRVLPRLLGQPVEVAERVTDHPLPHRSCAAQVSDRVVIVEQLARPVAEGVGPGADRQALQVPSHVARELLDRLVAAGRLLAQGGEEDRVQVAPEPASELLGAADGARPLRIGRPDRLDHIERRAAPKAIR